MAEGDVKFDLTLPVTYTEEPPYSPGEDIKFRPLEYIRDIDRTEPLDIEASEASEASEALDESGLDPNIYLPEETLRLIQEVLNEDLFFNKIRMFLNEKIGKENLDKLDAE